MKFIYLMVTTLLLTFLSCKSDNQGTFANEDYSISYNKSYDMDDSGINGTDLYIVLPHDVNQNFRNNINLLVQDLTEANLNLEQFVELTESQIKSSGQLIKSEKMNQNGTEYQSIIFEANFGEGDLKFLQHDFVQNNKAYILTYTATVDTFEENLSKAQEVMNSFKLKTKGK
ncbi:hypothetical protein [Sphingobacterium sp. SYP-B4668]|uniref:hypothetical protein n=1 Tax=Sphingobacterium sp. SYP-B4668 TaxID=2996035 RepID=UPI0022DDC98E|nr:hypothetical protein [Sphingobacterium sp. SYP-B4668]